jgi:putative holliday junction resolvase
MGRIMAIDYGRKRVGLAVTDQLQIIANVLTTVRTHEILAFLKDYISREPVDAFVLGMPVHLDGTPNEITPHVKGFHGVLQKNFPHIPVHLEDERYTSKMALSAMITGGMKKKDRRDKSNIDKISATILLQSHMEKKNLK